VTDAISATSQSALPPYGTDPNGVRSAVMSAASSVLGVDQQTLAGDLKSGQSLADIAQQKGISTDTLVSAIAQGIQTATGAAGASTQATNLATDIVNRKGGGHHHHHHGGPANSTDPLSTTDPSDPTDSTSPFPTVSSLLGMSQTDLLSTLEQGTSLSTLLSQSGLSAQSVTAALSQGALIDTTA